MWFADGDFMLSPARLEMLLGGGLVERTKCGAYRRLNEDPRREARLIGIQLQRRYGIARYAPTKEQTRAASSASQRESS